MLELRHEPIKLPIKLCQITIYLLKKKHICLLV